MNSQSQLHAISKSDKIGLIGVGNIGQAMAKNWLKNPTTFTLHGACDKNPACLDSLPPSVTRFSSPKDLCQQCDIVVTALPQPKDVKSVMEGSHGIRENIRAGSIWIDHSTTDYEQTLRFAELLKAKGVYTLEAPVTGGLALLKEGKMTMICGGEREVFDAMEPLLHQSCQNVLYLGKMGSATITKVISNMLAGANTVLMGEALMIAKRSNVDLHSFFNAIRLSAGNSFVFETEAPLIFKGTHDPDFAIGLHCKDFALGSEIAKKSGVPILVHSLVEQIYNMAKMKYGAESGSSHPPKLLEDALNTSLQIDGFENWTYSIEQVQGGSIGVVQKMKDESCDEK